MPAVGQKRLHLDAVVVLDSLEAIIEVDSKSKGGVYGVRNLVNHKVYIGSSVNLDNRLKVHRRRLELGKHCNKHLQAAWNKYGAEAFEFCVIKRCTLDRLIELEQELIDGSESYDPRYGYNICPRAGNTEGVIFTKERCTKISKALKGKRLPLETRLKMSAKRKGVKHSTEHQKAVNKALRRPEVRAKISAGVKAARARKCW